MIGTVIAVVCGIFAIVLLFEDDETEVDRNWALVLGPQAKAFLARLRFDVAAVDMVVREGMAAAARMRTADPNAALALVDLADETIQKTTPMRVGSISHLVRVLKVVAATLPLAAPRGFRLREVASLGFLVRAASGIVGLPEQRLIRLHFLAAGFRLVARAFRKGCRALRGGRDEWGSLDAGAADWTHLDGMFLETVETALADAALQRTPERSQVGAPVH